MTDQDLRWNQFIDEVCHRDLTTLSDVQKEAVLCFWYDAEMNNGGHRGYFDCNPNTNPAELVAAIISVARREIADNYQKAISEGEQDGWGETDLAYYDFSPSLYDCLREYVENNKDVIFS